jgi:hypothetical protein
VLEILAYPAVAIALLFAALRMAWWLTRRVFVFRSNHPLVYTFGTAVIFFPYLNLKVLEHLPESAQTARFPFLLFFTLVIVLRLIQVFWAAIRKNNNIHLLGADGVKLRQFLRDEVRALDPKAKWIQSNWDCPSWPVKVEISEDSKSIEISGAGAQEFRRVLLPSLLEYRAELAPDSLELPPSVQGFSSWGFLFPVLCVVAAMFLLLQAMMAI